MITYKVTYKDTMQIEIINSYLLQNSEQFKNERMDLIYSSFINRFRKHLPDEYKKCNSEFSILYRIKGLKLDESKHKFDLKVEADSLKMIETIIH